MKKQIILSSLLSALLIGNCLDTQAANEARTINDLPSMAKVSQNKREVSPEFPGGITALVQFLSKNLTYIIHSGFISGYQNRYGDNLKPPTNVYHRMTA